MVKIILYIINRFNRKLHIFKHEVASLHDLKNIDKDTLFEILRYGFMGVINTLVYAITGLALHRVFHIPPLEANFIAIGFSFITGFIGHNFYTYRQEKIHFMSLFRFVIVQIIALIISQSIVYLVVNVLHLIYEIALLLSIAILPPVVWSLGHIWVFRGEKRQKKSKSKK